MSTTDTENNIPGWEIHVNVDWRFESKNETFFTTDDGILKPTKYMLILDEAIATFQENSDNKLWNNVIDKNTADNKKLLQENRAIIDAELMKLLAEEQKNEKTATSRQTMISCGITTGVIGALNYPWLYEWVAKHGPDSITAMSQNNSVLGSAAQAALNGWGKILKYSGSLFESACKMVYPEPTLKQTFFKAVSPANISATFLNIATSAPGLMVAAAPVAAKVAAVHYCTSTFRRNLPDITAAFLDSCTAVKNTLSATDSTINTAMDNGVAFLTGKNAAIKTLDEIYETYPVEYKKIFGSSKSKWFNFNYKKQRGTDHVYDLIQRNDTNHGTRTAANNFYQNQITASAAADKDSIQEIDRVNFVKLMFPKYKAAMTKMKKIAEVNIGDTDLFDYDALVNAIEILKASRTNAKDNNNWLVTKSTLGLCLMLADFIKRVKLVPIVYASKPPTTFKDTNNVRTIIWNNGGPRGSVSDGYTLKLSNKTFRDEMKKLRTGKTFEKVLSQMIHNKCFICEKEDGCVYKFSQLEPSNKNDNLVYYTVKMAIFALQDDAKYDVGKKQPIFEFDNRLDFEYKWPHSADRFTNYTAVVTKVYNFLIQRLGFPITDVTLKRKWQNDIFIILVKNINFCSYPEGSDEAQLKAASYEQILGKFGQSKLMDQINEKFWVKFGETIYFEFVNDNGLDNWYGTVNEIEINETDVVTSSSKWKLLTKLKKQVTGGKYVPEKEKTTKKKIKLKKNITNSVCTLLASNFKYDRNPAGIILHGIKSANKMSSTRYNCTDHEQKKYESKVFKDQENQWKFNPDERVDLYKNFHKETNLEAKDQWNAFLTKTCTSAQSGSNAIQKDKTYVDKKDENGKVVDKYYLDQKLGKTAYALKLLAKIPAAVFSQAMEQTPDTAKNARSWLIESIESRYKNIGFDGCFNEVFIKQDIRNKLSYTDEAFWTGWTKESWCDSKEFKEEKRCSLMNRCAWRIRRIFCNNDGLTAGRIQNLQMETIFCSVNELTEKDRQFSSNIFAQWVKPRVHDGYINLLGSTQEQYDAECVRVNLLSLLLDLFKVFSKYTFTAGAKALFPYDKRYCYNQWEHTPVTTTETPTTNQNTANINKTGETTKKVKLNLEDLYTDEFLVFEAFIDGVAQSWMKGQITFDPSTMLSYYVNGRDDQKKLSREYWLYPFMSKDALQENRYLKQWRSIFDSLKSVPALAEAADTVDEYALQSDSLYPWKLHKDNTKFVEAVPLHYTWWHRGQNKVKLWQNEIEFDMHDNSGKIKKYALRCAPVRLLQNEDHDNFFELATWKTKGQMKFTLKNGQDKKYEFIAVNDFIYMRTKTTLRSVLQKMILVAIKYNFNAKQSKKKRKTLKYVDVDGRKETANGLWSKVKKNWKSFKEYFASHRELHEHLWNDWGYIPGFLELMRCLRFEHFSEDNQVGKWTGMIRRTLESEGSTHGSPLKGEEIESNTNRLRTVDETTKIKNKVAAKDLPDDWLYGQKIVKIFFLQLHGSSFEKKFNKETIMTAFNSFHGETEQNEETKTFKRSINPVQQRYFYEANNVDTRFKIQSKDVQLRF